jgi:hypothetical protein
MITDLVFWFILYPFLARNQYDMNFVSIQSHISGSMCSLSYLLEEMGRTNATCLVYLTLVCHSIYSKITCKTIRDCIQMFQVRVFSCYSL